jgi:hypothetical protein
LLPDNDTYLRADARRRLIASAVQPFAQKFCATKMCGTKNMSSTDITRLARSDPSRNAAAHRSREHRRALIFPALRRRPKSGVQLFFKNLYVVRCVQTVSSCGVVREFAFRPARVAAASLIAMLENGLPTNHWLGLEHLKGTYA